MGEKKPKISIITVCFNEIADIENTCKSIVLQSNSDFEWIVVDGGSTDGTLEILKRYESHIGKFVSEKDSGVYNAMNKGINLAEGEYLMFLNGGDSLYDNDVIKRVLDFDLGKNEILFGNCCVLLSNEKKQILDYKKNLSKYYFINNNINHQSALIKRELFDKFGLYDEKYRILADYEKWLCFITQGVSYLKAPFIIANYKGYDGLSSSNKTEKLAKKEKQIILNKYFNFFELLCAHLSEKIMFGIFSPGKFIKKYWNLFLSSRLRKPARKLYFALKYSLGKKNDAIK